MGLTFASHWMCPCPPKGCGIYLGTLVPTAERCSSKHVVSENSTWELLVAKHPVIGREPSCKCGVKTCANTPLHGQLDGPFGTFRGYHPPGCKSLKVDWRRSARPNMPIQVCVDTENDNVRCQNLMEVVIMHHISHVGGQGVELIDD
jgi:hypothetical protein